MPSTRKRTTKDGTPFYEISVSRGRGVSRLTSRWYPPQGWSQKAIDRELTKVAAEFERKVKAGEVITRAEKREQEYRQAMEDAQVKTFRQYCEKVFMPALTVRCAENTRESYEGNLRRWIYPAIADVKLPEVTTAQIASLLLSMQSQGKAHGTVVKTYTVLQAVFKMAYMADVIERNPMDKVERPRPRKGEKKAAVADAYTVKELQYILSCLNNEPLKWRTMVRLLVDTGMRRGECCGLQWKDVDFRRNVITICGNLCYTPSAGVYLDTPKNGKLRTIDIDPSVMDLLRQLRQEQSLKSISPYVFTHENSADPMHPQSPTRYLKKFSARYNIPGLHPHRLRHTFASVAITYGADVASVSEKLGHTDKAVTLRMYTHADEDSIKRAGDTFRKAVKEA